MDMIVDHEKALYNKEDGVMKQLAEIRIAMTDFVSKKAVLATVLSCLFLVVVVGTYMFGLDKRIVRIEEQFKALNDKQAEQNTISKDMLNALNAIKNEMNKDKP